MHFYTASTSPRTQERADEARISVSSIKGISMVCVVRATVGFGAALADLLAFLLTPKENRE